MAEPFVNIDNGYSRVMRWLVLNVPGAGITGDLTYQAPFNMDLDIPDNRPFQKIDYRHYVAGRSFGQLRTGPIWNYSMGVDPLTTNLSFNRALVGMVEGTYYPIIYELPNLQSPGILQRTNVQGLVEYSPPIFGGWLAIDTSLDAFTAGWQLTLQMVIELTCYY
jgi:hypothetical protein